MEVITKYILLDVNEVCEISYRSETMLQSDAQAIQLRGILSSVANRVSSDESVIVGTEATSIGLTVGTSCEGAENSTLRYPFIMDSTKAHILQTLSKEVRSLMRVVGQTSSPSLYLCTVL
jgi:hypothetical protein